MLWSCCIYLNFCLFNARQSLPPPPIFLTKKGEDSSAHAHIEHTLFPTNLMVVFIPLPTHMEATYNKKGLFKRANGTEGMGRKKEQESGQKVTSNHPLSCTGTANIQKEKLICFDLCQAY